MRHGSRALPGSAERLVNCHALLRKKARTILGDVEAILKTHAELVVVGDHRLVAEAHSRLELGLVALHEVGPFVSIESNAVSGTMRESRDFIARSIARVGDDLSRRRID